MADLSSPSSLELRPASSSCAPSSARPSALLQALDYSCLFLCLYRRLSPPHLTLLLSPLTSSRTTSQHSFHSAQLFASHGHRTTNIIHQCRPTRLHHGLRLVHRPERVVQCRVLAHEAFLRRFPSLLPRRLVWQPVLPWHVSWPVAWPIRVSVHFIFHPLLGIPPSRQCDYWRPAGIGGLRLSSRLSPSIILGPLQRMTPRHDGEDGRRPWQIMSMSFWL